MESMMDAVFESVSDVLLSKGIEPDICWRVSQEVKELFRIRLRYKYDEEKRVSEIASVKEAIKEAESKGNTGLS